MNKKKRRSGYKRKLFLYFFLAAAVPLMVLGFYSYFVAKDAVMKNTRQSNNAILLQIENKVDNALNSIYTSLMRIAGSSASSVMTELTLEEAMADYGRLSSFADGILTDYSYINYLSGYTFINYKHQWILSNKGMYTMEEVLNQELPERIRADERKLYWFKEGTDEDENMNVYSNYIRNDYLSLVVTIPQYGKNCDAAFLVTVSKEKFENMVRAGIGSGKLLIFDNDGNLIYSEDDQLAGYYLENKDHLVPMTGHTVSTGRKKYDVTAVVSDSTGWTYLAGFNSETENPELNQILLTMGVILILLSGAVVAIGMLGVRKMYQPVRELVDSVTMAVSGRQAEEGEDEFSLINQEVHTLAGRNAELNEMVERQKGQLKELFVIRLIRGQIHEDEIGQMWERLGILPCSCFCVLSAVFCPESSDDGGEQVKQDALNLEMMNRMGPKLLNQLLVPPVIYNRAIVFLVGAADEAAVLEKTQEVENHLEVLVKENCCGFVDIGVSRMFAEAVQFGRAHQESLEALKVNEYTPGTPGKDGEPAGSSVTHYGDLMDRASAAGYNLMLDTEIREAVDALNKEEAFRVVGRFIQELSGGGAVLQEKKYCLYRFLLAILSVPSDAGIVMNDILPGIEEDLFLRFGQLYDMKSVRHFFEEQVITPVIDGLKKFRKSSSELVMEKVMELVEETQGNVTLAECAEQLGYHKSYIWRVMKNTKDITFSDYAAEQKLELAKKLLEETDLSVNEIAERLSYSNGQNFIRVFKKHMEITPGRYRQMKREEKRES